MITCKLCGSSKHLPIISVKKANFSSRINKFDIYQCEDCGLSVIQPFPDHQDLEEIYLKERTFSKPYLNPYRKTAAFKILEPFYQRWGLDDLFVAKQCLSMVPKKSRRILDIGCSTGQLLSTFCKFPGVKVKGIDVDPDSKHNADIKLKDKIFIDNFLSHEFNEKFEIITLRFVIEHLPDFKEYINKAVSLLEDSGILFISTPDIDSPKAKILKDNWKLVNDPNQKIGHIFWFNKKSLTNLASSFNLKLEKCTNRGELIYHFPQRIQCQLKAIFGIDEVSGRFIKNYAPRVVYAALFDGLFSQTFSYGEHLYCFMRKTHH